MPTLPHRRNLRCEQSDGRPRKVAVGGSAIRVVRVPDYGGVSGWKHNIIFLRAWLCRGFMCSVPTWPRPNRRSLPFPTTALLLAVVAGMLVCAVWFLTRTNTTFAAALESISFSVPFKIYFATCQVTRSPVRIFAYASKCGMLPDPRCVFCTPLGCALSTVKGLPRTLHIFHRPR